MGRSFEGSRIRFGSRAFMDESKAHEFAARFPVGSAIEVFCDPNNPRRSVVYAGVTNELLAVLVAAPLMIFLGIGLVLR